MSLLRSINFFFFFTAGKSGDRAAIFILIGRRCRLRSHKGYSVNYCFVHDISLWKSNKAPRKQHLYLRVPTLISFAIFFHTRGRVNYEAAYLLRSIEAHRAHWKYKDDKILISAATHEAARRRCALCLIFRVRGWSFAFLPLSLSLSLAVNLDLTYYVSAYSKQYIFSFFVMTPSNISINANIY